MGTLQNQALAYVEHCKEHRSLSKHTVRAYKQDLVDFSSYMGIRSDARNVTDGDLSGYVQHLVNERGLSRATARRRLACLKGFCRWLNEIVDGVRVSANAGGLCVKVPKRLPRALCRTNLRELLRFTNERAKQPTQIAGNYSVDTANIDLTTHLCVIIMLTTGIRVSELAAIRLGDVSIEDGVIRIHGKGSKERVVFVTNGSLLGLLKSYYRQRVAEGGVGGGPLLVNARKAPLTDQSVRLRLRNVSSKMRLPRLTPHLLRHSAATSLIENGADIRFVQKLLGHASISTTELYTRVSDESLRKALTKADPLRRLTVEYR